MKIYVIHENNAWVEPLRKEFEALNLPYEEWFLDNGVLDLTTVPPEGVFYNRMSASSHTRDHRYGAEYAGAVLAWLERHGRRVLNNSRALQLEVSKVNQYMALNRFDIRTPRTTAVIGKDNIVKAAEPFIGKPFITKHNRGGKGLGVQLFYSLEALKEYLNGPTYEEPVDGVTLVQEYIEAPEPFITRCEFVGGEFQYAVRVDTSEGFQLCPADACQIGDMFCPVGETPKAKFQIIDGFGHPILENYKRFLAANGIDIAGIEMIVSKDGTLYTYDVNTNTNYNSDAEAIAGKSGMGAIARFLGRELERVKNQG